MATMLVRYRRFRHILIFERRGWLDRLVFALSIGIPLAVFLGTALAFRRLALAGEITAVNDQHAFLRLPPGTALDVGHVVRLGLSHPCTAFDKWREIPVVAGPEEPDLLQQHRDLQDVEFTIEDEQLYLLQTRSAKRTAAAAVLGRDGQRP